MNKLYTIFAPTDVAFAKLPELNRTALWTKANTQGRDRFLAYHFAYGDILSSALKPKQDLQTVEGGICEVKVVSGPTGKVIHVNAATVTRADLLSHNGGEHLRFRLDEALDGS